MRMRFGRDFRFYSSVTDWLRANGMSRRLLTNGGFGQGVTRGWRSGYQPGQLSPNYRQSYPSFAYLKDRSSRGYSEEVFDLDPSQWMEQVRKNNERTILSASQLMALKALSDALSGNFSLGELDIPIHSGLTFTSASAPPIPKDGWVLVATDLGMDPRTVVGPPPVTYYDEPYVFWQGSQALSARPSPWPNVNNAWVNTAGATVPGGFTVISGAPMFTTTSRYLVISKWHVRLGINRVARSYNFERTVGLVRNPLTWLTGNAQLPAQIPFFWSYIPNAKPFVPVQEPTDYSGLVAAGAFQAQYMGLLSGKLYKGYSVDLGAAHVAPLAFPAVAKAGIAPPFRPVTVGFVAPSKRTPPTAKEKEQKFTILGAAGNAAFAKWVNRAWSISEFKEFVENVFDALPAYARNGIENRTVTGKMRSIYDHFGELNFRQAFGNVLLDHFLDKAYAKGFNRVQRAERNLGQRVGASNPARFIS